jgi:hypothetical protein
MKTKSVFRILILGVILGVTGINNIYAAIFTVSSNAQYGAGSIDAAITLANAAVDRDSIVFTAAVTTIAMTGTINIINPVAIDGYNTVSPACGPGTRVQLNYSGNANSAIYINGTNNVTIRGLVITGVGIPIGININNSTLCRIEGNYIGITPNGLAISDINVRTNNQGIWIQNGSANTIGGPTCRERNVVSNYISCIEIVNSNNNSIINNYLGTDYLGTSALVDPAYGLPAYTLDYNSYGIHNIKSSSNTKITRNVVSGRRKYGIYFDRTTANLTPGDNAIVRGNLVGIGADSTTKLGNGWTGILFHMSKNVIIGGPLPADRNYSSNNGYAPVGNWETKGSGAGMQLLEGAGLSLIQNNLTGVSPNGKLQMPNAQDGISLLGSSGNVVKGNISEWNIFGIFLQGQLNYNVSPPTLTAACSNNKIIGNTVKYNGYSTYNTTEGGGIGLQFSASSNLIGVDSIGLGNTIDSNLVGIVLRNDNVNSGFANLTIYGAPANKIYNNVITRSITLSNPVNLKYPNMAAVGIVIHGDASDNNFVGGSGPLQMNTITNNGSNGVYIETGIKNWVAKQNLISCNGGATGAQGIRLATNSKKPGVIGNNNYGSTSPVAGHVTVNAPNTGSADASDSTGIKYLYKGYAPPSSIVYIYKADACSDCSAGNGLFKQGLTYLDSTTTSVGGIWSYSLAKPVGNGIVVYAIEPNGVNRNVSELSQCFSPACTPPSVYNISPSSPATVCKGTNVTLKGTGKNTYIYTWYKGGVAQNGVNGKANDSIFNATTTGLYTVRIADPSNPSNSLCYRTSSPVTVSVDTTTVPGSVGTSHSVCSGQVPQPFTSISVATGGNGTYAYQWQISSDNVTFNNIAVNGTSATYSAPTGIAAPTYYRRSVQAGTCPPTFSNVIKVSIDPAAIGGTISYSGTSVCSNSNSGTLTLGGGYSKTVKGWQSSIDNFATNTAITNFTNTLTFTNLSQTTVFRAIVSSGACPDAFSAPVTVKVDSAANGGTLATSTGASVCTGNNSGTLTLSNYKKSIKGWQSSVDNFATNTSIPNTNATLNFTNLTQTTQYRAIVSSGACADSNSKPITIVVNNLAVGGTISSTSGASVCSGTNNGTLTLAGYKTTVKAWQSSTDNFATNTLVNNSTPTLTFSNIFKTTQYRAIVSSGACPDVNSAPITIKVDTVSNGGTIATSGGSSVCINSNSGTLTLSGYKNSVKSWQSTTDNFATINTIANTTATLNFSNLKKTTQFRALVSGGSCPDVNSSPFTITVDTLGTGGIITSSTGPSVCTGTNSVTLTLSGYQKAVKGWQSSTDNFATTNAINNATATLTFSNIIKTTQFRAVVSAGSCPDVNSAPFAIKADSLSSGGTITPPVSASVCAGTNSGTLTLTNYKKQVKRWESSIDNFVNDSTVIPNSAMPSIQFSNLTKTTQYRAVVISGVCPEALSGKVSIKVDSSSLGGNAIADQNRFCNSGSTIIKLIQSRGAIVWSSSTDNVNFIDIAGETAPNYTTKVLNQTTYFRAKVSNGACSSVLSGIASVIIDPLATKGTISATDPVVCSGSNGKVTLANYYKSIKNWEYSVDNFVTTIPAGPADTLATFTLANLQQTTTFRANIVSGLCSNQSAIVSIKVDSTSLGGAATADKAEFCGSNSTTIRLANSRGAIQWASSTDNVNYSDISGATSASYTTPVLTQTTYYKATVTSGKCTSDPSVIATVTISAASIPGSITGRSPICANNADTLQLSGNVGSIKWEQTADTLKPFTTISGEIANTLYTPKLGSTTYYHAVVANGSCAPKTSQNFTVFVKQVPPFTAGSDTLICETSEFKLHASPGFKNYVWNNGAQGTEALITTSNTYTVKALSQNDCPVSATVNVGPCNFVQPPDVFTPDPATPGINDLFVIKGNKPHSSLEVYNRWGTLVYSKEDYENNWDGGGHSDGVYFYIYKQKSGLIMQGTVQIIR